MRNLADSLPEELTSFLVVCGILFVGQHLLDNPTVLVRNCLYSTTVGGLLRGFDYDAEQRDVQCRRQHSARLGRVTEFCTC